MKKVLALVLVFIMVAAAGIACADTLEFTPGSPTACAIEAFQLYYTLLADSAGYSFEWEENAVKEGDWDVYSALSSDGSLQIKIYCTDGNIVYAVSEGSITSDMSDTAAAEQFGQWFGVAIMDTCASLFIGEKGVEALTDDVGNRMTADFNALYAAFIGVVASEEDLVKGPALVGTMLDYPTGLETNGSIDGNIINLTMRIVTVSPDSTLNVQ